VSSCRPITDTWILARPKLTKGYKYYGAYPAGFLERARPMIGATPTDRVLHVCSGMVKKYLYAGGRGKNDFTLDLDSSLKPDFNQDARDPFPPPKKGAKCWDAILMDPPYTERDAGFYVPGWTKLPKPNKLVENGINAVKIGGKVGILHYIWPKPPENARCVALISVYVGCNNRGRTFTVFERTE